jgi:hypothetical protein
MSTPLMRTSPEDGFLEAYQSPEQGALSGAGTADHHDSLAVEDFEGEAMQDLAVAVLDAQIARGDDRAGGEGAAMLCGSPRQVEQDGEDEIDQDDQQDGNDHGRSGGASDFFGARAGGEALLAAHRGDDQPEDQALTMPVVMSCATRASRVAIT